MKKTNKSNWEKVGSVGADSGLIWVGDPCYCVTPDCNEHPAETWDKFCDKLFKNEKNGVCQWNYKMGHAGLGVSVSSGYGDGVYDVFVKRKDNRIAEVKVVFIE